MSMALVAASAYFMFRSWDYNAMINGDDCAKSLGVNTRNVRLGGMFFSSLLVAIAVSFMGIISFIGLISPQIMRRIIGNDHRFLIPGSALFGSLILLVSDTVARTIISPVILPVGVITSFMGAPLFIYILMRDYKN
jgi:iron complex transport system permease protein